jgi:1A family penicillin-binding protein
MVARHPRGFVVAMLALALTFWSAMGAAALMAHQVFDGIPDRSHLNRVTQMARASVFFDRHNQPAFSVSREQRLEVPLEQVSPHLQRAIIAIEDQRFHKHRGVDLFRIAGAAVANFREGRTAQGASTITQQLARMSFLTPEKIYTRKVQEAVVAGLLESDYSKDQILELYLNKVYFGSGLYGAEAAALGYFGKHAADLDVAEAALLAGLVKAPSSYAPTSDVDRAISRRAVVLDQMREMGVIDEPTLKQAKAARVVLVDALRREEPYGRFFKEHVKRELIARFGEERVYEAGLKVYTTIDVDMQRAADAEVQRVLIELDKRRAKRGRTSQAILQAALLALDPRTGEVRAMIGGRDFIQSNYNRAIHARRQAGSAFKPFVYAAALEAGYSPASLITDLDRPIDTPEGAWVPEDGHSSADAMTMRAALKISSNRAAVRMIESVGIGRAVSYAERLGVRDIPRVPAAALGAGDVTLESLTAAYSVFANGGVRRPPVYINRVEDADGQVLFQAPSSADKILSPQTAFLMNDMLSDVIDHGTAWKARQLGFKLPAAGKTGTTNEYRDAWFVGYTPRLVTGVWVGFDQPQTIIGGGYAAEIAVPLWASFMRKATSGDAADWYKAPSGVVTATVCRISGKRPVNGCYNAVVEAEDGSFEQASTVYTEYFAKGTVPSDECPVHSATELEIRRTAGDAHIWTMPGVPLSDARPAIASSRASDEEERRIETPRVQEPDVKEPEKKKRGFWSRIFGRGDKKDDNQNKDRDNKDSREIREDTKQNRPPR